MKTARLLCLSLLCVLMLNLGWAGAQQTHKVVARNQQAAAASAEEQEEAQLAEGEKRFRTDCGRCHMAPHKFPPRMMATIVRHMRVRALITDEDMKLILRYMSQ